MNTNSEKTCSDKKAVDILHNIKLKINHMSKGQRTIARYILEHYDKAAYLTASRLAEDIGVSESTIVRFAMSLGYSGYPQLKIALEDLVKSRLTASQRIEISTKRVLYKERSALSSILQNDAQMILETAANIDEGIFESIVEAIINAKKVYLIAGRSSSLIAGFLAFYLNLMLDNVICPSSNTASEMFEHTFRIEKGDLCFAISFPRYSQRTVRIMKYAQDKGATTAALTDNRLSPLAEYSDYSLYAGSDMVSFIDSLVAPLSVVNAILVAVSMKNNDKLVCTLDQLEKIWNEYQVYASNNEYKYINTEKNEDQRRKIKSED